MFTAIQKNYDFTDYQIAQLKYTFTVLFSELSKCVLIAFFYRNDLALYFYAVLLLGLLRLCTGGLHAKTYLGCLCSSFLFFYAALCLLPRFQITKPLMYAILIGCIGAVIVIGPVASPFRKINEHNVKKRFIFRSVILIAVHCILFGLFDHKFLIAGNWIVLLQTIQLVIAKIISRR